MRQNVVVVWLRCLLVDVVRHALVSLLLLHREGEVNDSHSSDLSISLSILIFFGSLRLPQSVKPHK